VVGCGEAEGEGGALREVVGSAVALSEALRESVGETEALTDSAAEAVTVQVMVTDTVCVTEGGGSVSVAVWLVEALALRVTEGVALVEGLQEGEAVGTTLRVTEGDSLLEALALGESVALADTEGVCVSTAEADSLAVADTEGVSEGGGGGGRYVSVTLALGVTEPLLVSLGEGVPEGDTVGEADSSDEGVAVVVAEE
jgi:hypothetical protein